MEGRIKGTATGGSGVSYSYEVSWHRVDDAYLWDSVISIQGHVKAMPGGRFLVSDSVPDPQARIEAYLRTEMSRHIFRTM